MAGYFRIEKLIFILSVASVFLGCVNPPQRSSGVTPKASPSPTNAGRTDYPPADDALSGGRPPAGRGNVDNPNGVAPTSTVKVRYWLNKTDNDNCLTIQPVGSASISSKCVSEGAVVADWVSQDLAAAADGTFKATIKVDTKDKPSGRTISSATDNMGENSWRWRCVKTTDAVTATTVHTICYEDGNTLAKTFDSSDLFVQITGPAGIDLTGLQCTAGQTLDLVKCAAN